MQMIRKQEFYHLLHLELEQVEQVRQGTLGDILQAELDLAQGELDGLTETFNETETAWNDF